MEETRNITSSNIDKGDNALESLQVDAHLDHGDHPSFEEGPDDR